MTIPKKMSRQPEHINLSLLMGSYAVFTLLTLIVSL